MNRIDLHIHSTHSDGTMKPVEIVDFAARHQLQAISITDHDSVASYTEALVAGDRMGVEIISGVEISALYGHQDLHILGYCIDVEYPALVEYTKQIRDYRETRAKKIINKLKTCGIHIPWQLVLSKSNGGVIGRPHIADVLIEEGHVFSFRDAFNRYLGDSGLAFVPKTLINPEKAISIIHQAGGIACIAHPGVDIADRTINELVEMGLDGIEVYHPKHDTGNVKHFLAIAQKKDLIITGGSDSHGTRIGDINIGSLDIPYSLLEEMKNFCKI